MNIASNADFTSSSDVYVWATSSKVLRIICQNVLYVRW